MAKSSKSIVAWTDVHDGATTALCSAEPYNSELDTTIKLNKIQKTLRHAWLDSIDELEQKPDLLVLNGEPIDGANKKQVGQQSWSTNLEDQMSDFIKLSEEIPYWLQKNIVEQFKKKIIDVIIENNLSLSNKINIDSNFTPLRLIFSCRNLIKKQKSLVKEIKGPPVNAPENAIMGFLKKVGVTSQQKIEEAFQSPHGSWFHLTTQHTYHTQHNCCVQ